MKKFLQLALSLALIIGVGVSSFALRKAGDQPKRAGDYPVIYGSMVYANSFRGGEVGLYEIPTTWDGSFELLFTGPAANAGGFARDGIYYSVSYSSSTGSIVATITAWDLNSGKELETYTSDHTVLGHLALDPMSNEVYGITFRPEMGGYMLSSITLENGNVFVQKIANLDGMWAAFAIDSTGQFYGIKKTTPQTITSIQADLYRIDRETGKTTLVGNTGMHPYDNTDATIDPATDRMYWAVSNPDMSQLVEVDLNTGKTTTICEFDDLQQMAGIFVPTPAAQPGAPEICTNISFDFGHGEMKGTMSFDAPATLFNSETPGTGRLDVIAITKDDQVGYGQAEWGKPGKIEIDMTDYEPGVYSFTIMAINSVGEGPKAYVNNFYVGVDSPSAPEPTLAYSGSTMKLEWDPVQDSEHGGWFDRDIMTYTVRRADGSVAASGLKTTSWTENVTEPKDITECYYTVTAVCGSKQSAQGKSNTILLGSCPLPYTSDYAENGFKYFTVIDGNNDGTTWTIAGNNVACSYNQYERMNDWLITPPFKLEANKPYVLKFSAFAQMSNSKECLEVMVGNSNTAEAMTTTVLEPTFISQTVNKPREFELYIIPKTTGNYYIGFHGISDPYMYALTLSDFTLQLSPDAENPGMPQDFKVTPAEDGSLKAEVSFKAPSVTIGGDKLQSMTKLEVYREETLIKTFTAPTPGAALKVDDTLTKGGWTEYSAVAYNDNGKGAKASASAFVGQDIPATPTNVLVSRTDVVGEAKVTWSPVTLDRNGKPVHGSITYNVMRTSTSNSEMLKTGLAETSYTFVPAGSGSQQFVQVLVSATSEAGTGEYASSDVIPVGVPYDAFAESFAGGVPAFNWGEQKDAQSGEVRWEVYTDDSGMPASDGDNGFLAFYANTRGLKSLLYSGLISMKGFESPALSFNVYNNATQTSVNNNILNVCVRVGDDVKWTPVWSKTVNEAVDGNPGWTRVTIPFDKFVGKDIQIGFEGEAANYLFSFIDAIEMRELPLVDMQLSRLSVPYSVKNGSDYTANVKVSNYGAETNDGYKVELYVDGTLSATQNGRSLRSGESTEFIFPLSMAVDATEAVAVSARIVLDDDEDQSNNVSEEATVRPAYSSLPGATELAPNFMNDGVRLTWKAAKSDIEPGQYLTQDFEDGDAFATTYGDWVFVDVDGAAVTGPKDYQIPNVEYGVTTGSFWVWDTDVLPVTGIEANSGSKFLFSLCRKDGGTANDWAISPELSGDAQTISFVARSIVATYPEQVEVWYSEGSINPDDFTKLSDVGGKVPGKWTEYKATLPAGAKRFAIRSCATDAFVLMVDDVTYIPADPTGGMKLEGYDLYKNHAKVNAAPMAECEYTDKTLVEFENYSYTVVSVYDGGYGKPSNVVSFLFNPAGVDAAVSDAFRTYVADGRIVVEGAEGHEVTVANVNGMLLWQGVASGRLVIPAPNAVYVVRVGKETKKLNVSK